MRLSREQFAARTTVIAAVGRQLRDSWRPEAVGPAPDNLARLASRFEEQGECDAGGRERISLTVLKAMPGAERHEDREMKSRTKRKRLNELTPKERKVLEAAATSCPIEELDIDLVLDQARVSGELTATDDRTASS